MNILLQLSAAMILGGGLVAEPVADDGRVRQLLGTPDKIVFLAGFCEMLDALDASNIGVFYQTLGSDIKKEDMPVRHAADAVKMAEQRWAKLDPKGFLETCATRRHPCSAEAQMEAMAALLKTDREHALRLFLQVPLHENFGSRCGFYERLAALDPGRAVRFFFETSERDRIFDNPLEISFRAWARRDFKAAWAGALRITEQTWSRPARTTVLNHAVSQGIDKACALLESIPDSSARDEAAGDLIHIGKAINASQAIEIAKRIDSLRVWRDLAFSEHLGKPEDAVRKLLEVLPPARRVAVLAAYIKEKGFEKPGPAEVRDLYALIPDENQREAVRRVVAGRAEHDDSPMETMPADLVLEELLEGGVHAYEAIMDEDKAAALAKAMFQKFPERSLPWLMQLSGDARLFRMRDLVAAWPVEKLAADTARYLESASAVENEFGIALGRRWLKEDPETALLVIFSEHARHAALFQQSIAFYRLKGALKWEPARIEKLLDQIKDPQGQAIARREWAIECLRDMPAADAVPRIVALPEADDRRRAASNVIYKWLIVGNDPEALDHILAISPEHGETRDMILAMVADGITDRHGADASRLPDILTAIRDPSVRLKVMAEIRDASAVKPHSERLAGLLATMVPGAARDQQLAAYLGEIPPVDALALAKRTDQMLIRSLILARLVACELTDAQAAECEALLASLPATHRDGRVGDLWLFRNAKRDPAAHWPQVMKRVAAYASVLPMACEVVDVWSETAPRATTAACLRIEDPAIRRDLLRRCLAAWLRKDPPAAIIWVRGLPTGPVRCQALLAVSAALPKDQARLADDLAWEAYLESPDSLPMIVGSLNQERGNAVEKRMKTARENRSTVRSLADLDFETVAASTRGMQEGEAKDLARLGLLDHALGAGKADLTASLTAELLAKGDPRLSKTVVETVIASFKPDQADKALEFSEKLELPETRYAAAAMIISRWTAPDRRQAILGMIRGFPDPGLRHALASRFLTGVLKEAEWNAQALEPWMGTAMERAGKATALADLASALLDGRTADAEAAIDAMPDDASRAKLKQWINNPPAGND